MKLKPALKDVRDKSANPGDSIIYWPSPDLKPVFAAIKGWAPTNARWPNKLELTMDPNVTLERKDRRKYIKGTQYLIVSDPDLPDLPDGEVIGKDAFDTNLSVGDPVIGAYKFEIFFYETIREYTSPSTRSRMGLAFGKLVEKNSSGYFTMTVDKVQFVAANNKANYEIQCYSKRELMREDFGKDTYWSDLHKARDEGKLIYSGWNRGRSIAQINVPRVRIVANKASRVYFKKRLLF